MLFIVQRYLAASFIPPFVVSTVFFVLFLLTFQLFRIIRIVSNKNVNFETIFNLVGHIAISFLPLAIPLSIFFALIFTLNKLSEDSEIVAMRSFGWRNWDLFKTFLILGGVVALMTYGLNSNVIPYSKGKFKNTIIKLTSTSMLSEIRSGKFFTDIPNITLFAEEVSEGGEKMKDVFLQVRSGEGKEKVIFARKGALIKQMSRESEDLPALRLFLTDGNIVETEEKTQTFKKILFNIYDFPVLSSGLSPSFMTKNSMKNNQELRETIEEFNQKIDSEGNEGKRREYRQNLNKAKLEYYSRINTALLCLVFITVGFGLGIKRGRGKSRSASGAGLLILFVYYIVFFAGISFSKKGQLPPSVAIFMPTILLTFVSAHLYKKLDWAS